MPKIGKKLKSVLEGYVAFLRKRELVLPGHQQRLVRWVREFLLFAEEHGGYTFEQTLDLHTSWRVSKAIDVLPPNRL